jgi:integrase/recombinase XerD
VAWTLRVIRHPPRHDRSGLGSSHIAHRVALPDGREAWTVLDVSGAEVGSVSAFLRYLHRIERSPNTVRAYAHDLMLFWDFLADRALAWDAVTVADLGDFAAWLRRPAPNVVPLPGVRPARSPATTNRALTAVMGFYEFHARHGVPVAARLVEQGRGGRGSYRPFLYGIAKGSSRARVGRLRTVHDLPKVLTLAQMVAVIAAQRRLRDRLLFALLAETGMRVSQALGLRHEDMRTWERRVELVAREDNANGARGKGSRGFAIVSDQLVRLHALYMAEEYGLIDSDYVFVNLWAGEIGAPLRYGAVDALVRRTRARVGFDFHPHMFRHTFVTVARRHGMPLDVISKAVGHACVQTTADIYSHLDAEDLRRELAAAGMLDRLGDLV